MEYYRTSTRSALALGLLIATSGAALAQNKLAWDKTFPPSEQVTVERVSFQNRLGIQLVGDLYLPKTLDRSARTVAIIVGHPYGGVKEQTSGLYAQQMAERGFVTLAFDASYNGESGGQPHGIASPEAFVEDLARPWTTSAPEPMWTANASVCSTYAAAAASAWLQRRSTRA